MIRRREAQTGFTLIEFTMALVMAGIVAAVAVPRYFDLQDKAEEKVMNSVAAEFTAQFGGFFARHLLSGEACADASASALDEALASMNGDVTLAASSSPVYVVNPVRTSGGLGVERSTGTVLGIVVKRRSGDEYSSQKQYSLLLPHCAAGGAGP